MRGGRATRVAVLLITGASLFAAVPVRSQRFVTTTDPEHPRLKYADSLVSLNDRCIVRMVKLNPKVRPVYVSRMPVGFC
jgi:hypothetical protein